LLFPWQRESGSFSRRHAPGIPPLTT
jgi:hypothetical protein